MTLRFPFLFLLCILAASCDGASHDQCGACATDQFCCLGSCLPLGSVCGSSDSGPPDAAPSDLGGAGPCAPLPGATSVVGGCLADGVTVTTCPLGQSQMCSGAGPQVCIEWVDASGLQAGYCRSLSWKDPCDPARDTVRCKGAVRGVCQPLPGDVPPGYWENDDCTRSWAPDATCQIKPGTSTPICTSPTDVVCDPATFVSSCSAGRCVTVPLFNESVIRPFCTVGEFSVATHVCVQNTYTNNAPACLPAGAVPGTHAATPNEVALSCDDSSTVHYERYGYEYSRACPPTFHLGDGGATTTQNVCYQPASGPPGCTDGSAPLPPPCGSGFVERCFDPDRKWSCGTATTGTASVVACLSCTWQPTGVQCN